MLTDQFGFWSMIAFWASAIGGIFIGVQWAKSRRKKSPAPRDVIVKSLKKRLEEGEITQETYDKRVAELDDPQQG